MGGALNAEFGELPVDILDRGSDVSEAESAGRSNAVGPIAIDNSDDSDHEVDVENIDESGSLPGSDDDKGPMREADTKAANQRGVGTVDGGENNAAPTTTDPVRKRDSGVSTADSRLLATILNDLKGIAAPKCDLSLNSETNCSSDTRKRRFRDQQREVSRPRSSQDDWSAEMRDPNPGLPKERQSDDRRDQSQGFDFATRRTSSIPLLPPLERLKECRVREGGRDVPPLLKQASPVQSHNRNTPPPLKHKDAGSPHLLAASPAELHSPRASADADLSSNPPKEKQVIPPISTLKRHFRGELASAIDMHPSCHLAPIDSHSTAPSKVGALTIGIHSMSRKPPVDSRSSSGSENSSTSADCLPHLDFNSFHSSKLHSSRDGTKELSSGPRSPPIDLHLVNSLSAIDFHSAKTGWSKEKPAHPDATSRGCRNKTRSPNSCRVAPVDLHPSSSVSADGTPAGSDVFSGANCNNISPPVFVSSIDSRTQNPSPPINSHSPSERENLSPPRVNSVPTTVPSSRLSPIDVHPRSPKSTIGLHSSSAASDGPTDNASPFVNHE